MSRAVVLGMDGASIDRIVVLVVAACHGRVPVRFGQCSRLRRCRIRAYPTRAGAATVSMTEAFPAWAYRPAGYFFVPVTFVAVTTPSLPVAPSTVTWAPALRSDSFAF